MADAPDNGKTVTKNDVTIERARNGDFLTTKGVNGGSVKFDATGYIPPLEKVSTGDKCAIQHNGQWMHFAPELHTSTDEVTVKGEGSSREEFPTLTYFDDRISNSQRVVARPYGKNPAIIEQTTRKKDMIDKAIGWINDINKPASIQTVQETMQARGVICQNDKGQATTPALKYNDLVNITVNSLQAKKTPPMR